MEKAIQWLPDIGAAYKKAKAGNRFVLLDFFNPL